MRQAIRVLAWTAVPIGFAIPLLVQLRFAHEPATAFIPGDFVAALYHAIPFTVLAGMALWSVSARARPLNPRHAIGLLCGFVVSVGLTLTTAWSSWRAVYDARVRPSHMFAVALGPVLVLGLVLGVYAAGRRLAARFPLGSPSSEGTGDRRASAATLVLAALLALTALLQALSSLPSLWFSGSILSIREAELLLQRPDVYRPVAERLALYCQSDRSVVPETLGPSSLPGPLRLRRNLWIHVSQAGASVELGGGFHHFGYSLDQDPPRSSVETNAWRLSFRSEDSPDRPLVTVRTPATARVSREQFLAWQKAAFEQRLAAFPSDDITHSSRVQALIRLGEPEAALLAADEWVRARPDSVIPRFTRAHVLARVGRIQDGRTGLVQWVEAHRSFEHRCYLFLFYMREGLADAALLTIRGLIREPMTEESTSTINDYALAYDAAVFAFLHEDRELCISVCDKALGARPEDWRREFLLLKGAAQALVDQGPAAQQTLTLAADAPPSWRDASQERRLTEAIRAGDLALVADYSRWKDPISDWTNPLDEDETHMRGGDKDRLPNPYPSDWRRHAGF
jgi:hypothetical protein